MNLFIDINKLFVPVNRRLTRHCPSRQTFKIITMVRDWVGHILNSGQTGTSSTVFPVSFKVIKASYNLYVS